VEVIALDVGTTQTKCSIIDAAGRTKYSASCLTGKIQTPHPGFMEMDPEEIYANTLATLRAALRKARAQEVLISLSSMAPVLVLADKRGNPVRHAILYNDSRTSHEVSKMNESLNEGWLLKMNGNVANTQQWGPKLLWLQRREPGSMSRTRNLFDLTSFLLFRLTGRRVIDFTVAQETGLLDYRRRKWCNEILSFLNLDEDSLPSLRRTGEVVGSLVPTITSKLIRKRRSRPEIDSGCVDSIATALSLGLVSSGVLAIEVGTTGIVTLPTKTPRLDRRLYLDLSPIDGLFYVSGTTVASGLFLQHLVNLISGERSAISDFEREGPKELSNPPIVMLPYIGGERTPIMDPLARAVIFGLSLNHTRGDVIRAGMESVAYSFRHHIKILSEVGYKFGNVRITGGGAKSARWREIMVDVLGRTLQYYGKASASLGSALIAYKSLGIVKRWRDVEEWMGRPQVVKPDRSKRAAYDRLFEVYLDLYVKLRDDFRKVHDVAGSR